MSFRPADHVFTMKTLIDQAYKDKEGLYVCFVDFRKAYDTVWRDGLYHKLLNYNVNPAFVRLLRNIYKHSSLAVKTQSGRSSIFASNVGLKQGCNLSPLLFNLFINDFLTEVSMSFTHSPHLEDTPVNALMYADDLVLISKSENGLQNLLDILHRFTESWFLQVNKSKTKCMHFSRSRTPTSRNFNFGDNILEVTDQYCYLGTVFSKNGSLNEAGRVLHDKAQKAMYGLLGRVNKHKTCDPKLLLSLFDKMIFPIASYNSEVWGTMCFPQNPRNNDFLNISINRSPIEDIQTRFCKRILRVSDKATNWAVLSECGRLPTIIQVICKIVGFWHHIIQSPSPILQAALRTNGNLASSGVKCWFFYFKRCLKFLDIEHILYTTDTKEVHLKVGRVKKILLAKAQSNWDLQHSKLKGPPSSKLDLYSKIKSSFGYSNFLSAPISSESKADICKMRISAHNLPVETDRYSNIPRQLRICPLCCRGVGNESHYITECSFPRFSSLRETFFKSISTLSTDFPKMNASEQAVFLLSSANNVILSKMGKFSTAIRKCFREIRSNKK